MAEFCLECLKRMDSLNYEADDFVYSKDLELCEGCGEMKHVVVKYREETLTDIIRRVILEEKRKR